MSEPRPGLSLVLPAYNEAESLPDILGRFARCAAGRSVELIVVDNGSRDRTEEVLRRELAKPEHRNIRSVRVPVNQGYGFGIWSGLQEARGEYLAWSHADMQCDPADVLRAWDRLLASPNPRHTLVKGARRPRGLQATILTLGMQTVAQLTLQQPIRDINAQPKVFHRSLIDHLSQPARDLSFDLYVLHRALRSGWLIRTIPVTFERRRHGASRWAFSLLSRWKHILASIRYMFRLAPGRIR